MNYKKNSFCNNCGKEVEEGMNFCLNCGAKIISFENTRENSKEKLPNKNELYSTSHKELKESTENTYDSSNNLSTTNNLNPISKNNTPKDTQGKKSRKISKLPLIFIIIFIILALSGYVSLEVVKKTINNPEKLVENFKISMSDANYEDLQKIIKSSDTRLEINEDTLKPSVSYFKSNPSKLGEICTNLNKSIIVESPTYDMFYLEKESGLQGLIGKYKIVVSPVFFKVDSKLDETKVFLNEKEYDTLKKGQMKEIGPLMPGEYEIVSKYTGEYVTLENKVKKDLITTDSQVYSIFADIRTVTISTEYTNAKVIVNGKNTGKTVEQLSYKLSPVDIGTKIQLELDVDGKKFTTSEKIVGDNSIVEFEKIKDISQYIARKDYIENFEKNLDNKVLELMNEYSKAFQSAVNSRSFSYLTSTLYPSSNLYNEQQDYVNKAATSRIYEYFKSLSTKNINYDAASLTGTVDVEEIYGTSTNGNYEEKTYYYKYTFKYNETAKRFQLSEMVKN